MTDIYEPDRGDVVIEMELCINQRLHENGYITTEMHEKAKTMILKKRRVSSVAG